jgi:hypothetical protein
VELLIVGNGKSVKRLPNLFSQKRKSEVTSFASLKSDYNFFFPVAFTFAHLAFANADSLALAAALIVNFLAGFTTGAGLTATADLALAALIFAHLAF